MNTRNLVSTLLAAGFLVLAAHEAHAQIGLAGEGRVGVTFPTGDISDAGGEAGLSVGGELQVMFYPNLTAYLGLHRHAFTCDDDCTLGSSPRSSGLGLGLKYIFHNPGDTFVWGRGGIVANQVTGAGSEDRNIGFELGAGFDMPIAARTYLVPNVGFVSHDAGSGFTASFITLGIGLHYHLN